MDSKAWLGILFFAYLAVAAGWLVALRLRLARQAGGRVSNARLRAMIAAGDPLARNFARQRALVLVVGAGLLVGLVAAARMP
jgi:hypothetical protein